MSSFRRPRALFWGRITLNRALFCQARQLFRKFKPFWVISEAQSAHNALDGMLNPAI